MTSKNIEILFKEVINLPNFVSEKDIINYMQTTYPTITISKIYTEVTRERTIRSFLTTNIIDIITANKDLHTDQL